MHTILLGSVGGDSHSVGLTIIREALVANGYQVEYLGTQNQLSDFVGIAEQFDLIMISNMDGHAWYYINTFPDLKAKYKINSQSPLWYLGGNLTIGDGLGQERKFYEIGFSRVFVKPIDIDEVLRVIRNDLSGITPKNKWLLSGKKENQINYNSIDFDEIHEKYNENTFLIERNEVLESWKTGFEAKDIENNAEFLNKQTTFHSLQEKVLNKENKILVQPRTGVEQVERQINIFQKFKGIGAKVLSYQVDSLTRNNNYSKVDEILKESSPLRESVLNGFPVINHGVSKLRKIVTDVNLPIQVRHSTKDPRLLAEISLAGGCTSFEGGAICYNIPYYKNYCLTDALAKWRYVDRLVGLYYEKYQIIIDREFFGVLTATLVPPCLAIVTGIIEAILAAQQGVMSVSPGYAEQGNRSQDIAAIRVMRDLTRKVLDNLGFKNVYVNTVFSQYMAAFPTIPSLAQDLIRNSAITADLSGATRMLIKTPVEAFKIPSLNDNLGAYMLVNNAIKGSCQENISENKIQREYELITEEVESILDSIFLCGHANLAMGLVKGFEKGLIDIPFAPSKYNLGRVITARDVNGAVRFVSTGNLNLGKNIKEFHKQKIQDRLRSESINNSKNAYKLVEKDVLQVSRGQYQSWPLDKLN